MTEKQTTEQAAKKVAGGREDAKAESQKAGEQSQAHREKERAANPDSPDTTSAAYHAPSTPDQASEAEKDAADNAPFVGVEGEVAPDNAIEATIRRMAGEGRTSGEIAAYKADAFAKLAK